MSHYQIVARKYRPQTFAEVLGQEAVVTILKNALRKERVAQAYLFSGPHGTGKTTLARLLAKALNCQNLSPDFEPCNQCISCLEIMRGSSMDVIEIDGASHRGVEDIRQINETVGYASTGRYKIFLIDEVHMLTKEAFNALLKTLEEPPQHVKFLFATTEPHKILPTILSRCQCFHLKRVSSPLIIDKLRRVIKEAGGSCEDEALLLIARRAEGSLRDAESLLDQLLATNNNITSALVSQVLGLVPREALFELDRAGKEGRLAFAFELAERIFSEGYHAILFVEMVIEHIRNLLAVKLAQQAPLSTFMTETELQQTRESANFYRKEQLLTLLDDLSEMYTRFHLLPSERVALETLLLHVLRSHYRIPVEFLVRRLVELEKNCTHAAENETTQWAPVSLAAMPTEKFLGESSDSKRMQVNLQDKTQSSKKDPPIHADKCPETKIEPTESKSKQGDEKSGSDPERIVEGAKLNNQSEIQKHAQEEGSSQYDTLLHFAAVELEGKLEKL